ncbi:MAG TPA: transposase [Coleofasciculaceae cyanobacterium]|jgi:IS605 OrfB family transposase
MEIKRTVTILLPKDPDLLATVKTFQQVQQALSELCYNSGKPLGAIALQHKCYDLVKGKLNAQMTISAIRLVASAYKSAKSNKKPAFKPFNFRRAKALFLVGQRGRDADFRADGTLSIWTVGGRKRLTYKVPKTFQYNLSKALEVDSLTVIERDGKLIGRVRVTLEAPEPRGIHPVGIDLNETNTLVAVDADDRELFISGQAIRIKNYRTNKTQSRLHKKLAARKAEKKDTRSCRRLLKRLGRKQRNRTRTFCKQVAKQLVNWVLPNSVLVFEDVNMPKVSKKLRVAKGVRCRLAQWEHNLIRLNVTSKAQERGMIIEYVNPRYTSQTCSRCGLRGRRKRYEFECPHCGHKDHADKNAAVNIRNRYTVLRSAEGGNAQALSQGGESWSVDSEAQEQSEGKLAAPVVGN